MPDSFYERFCQTRPELNRPAQASELGNMDQGLQLNNIHRRILQQKL
jgi:hypothetical protein